MPAEWLDIHKFKNARVSLKISQSGLNLLHFTLARIIPFAKFCSMQAIVVRLSEQATQKAKSGDFPQALHLFTQALAANPALPVTRRDLAMLHYELGDLSAAKDQLIDALRLAPDDA
jgi:tetratricopeptide (TPR) repeat protein